MKLLYQLIVIIAATACAPGNEQTMPQKETLQTAKDKFPEKAKDMTIYEVNIRQHTPEGTFAAFEKDLPRIKDLGADILWLMPIQPIGEKNRKGSLGSYYSIKDYKATNAEFGTLDDFKSLVKKAHELGFYVILDWVPNHTAWDHPWVESHPEYYMSDSAALVVGEMIGQGKDYYKKSGTGNLVYEADWSDIALLNLFNEGAQREMIDAMRFWIEETDIDGFRADHAFHEIPLFFWEEATKQLDPLKDLFWLAEADQPRMHLTFDATYQWKLLHLTEDVAKGKKTAEDIHDLLRKDLALYGQRPFRMVMITNHDENAWAGTIKERYGEGDRAFAVFAFTAYGTPMIYSGQEAGLNKRLEFFEKDTISWDDPEDHYSFYKKLNQLKKNNPALYSGEYGGMHQKLDDKNEHVLSFVRRVPGNQVVGIINLSATPQQIDLTKSGISGQKTDVFTGMTVEIGAMTLNPWQYLMFCESQNL